MCDFILFQLVSSSAHTADQSVTSVLCTAHTTYYQPVTAARRAENLLKLKSRSDNWLKFKDRAINTVSQTISTVLLCPHGM